MVKISVISPIYNGEKYIGNLIKSLTKQTFKDFEFILINDGSTDNTVSIAENELKKTKLNYKIINQKNGGQSKARNNGIKHATGEWFVTVDSDDTLNKDYLKNLYKASQKYECNIVLCDLNRVEEKNIFNESKDPFKCDVYTGKEAFIKFIMHELEIGPYSLFINRKYINKIKLLYNENSRYSEEFIFINYILYNAKNVIHLKQKLYNYCLRSGSVSTGASIEKIINGFNEILKSNVFYEQDNCKYCQIYNKYAMPRWVLATARFSSKNLSYTKFKELLNKIEFRKYIPKLSDFPSKKIRIASFVLEKCPIIAYFIFRYKGKY